MKITVTEQDWRLGTKMCAFECPVWIAVTRKLNKRYPHIAWRGQGLPVIVTSQTLVFGERFKSLQYAERSVPLPPKVQARIRDFDTDRTGKVYARLVFTVELPKKLRREIKRCLSTSPSDKKTSISGAEIKPTTPPSDVRSIEPGTTSSPPRKSSRSARLASTTGVSSSTPKSSTAAARSSRPKG